MASSHNYSISFAYPWMSWFVPLGLRIPQVGNHCIRLLIFQLINTNLSSSVILSMKNQPYYKSTDGCSFIRMWYDSNLSFYSSLSLFQALILHSLFCILASSSYQYLRSLSPNLEIDQPLAHTHTLTLTYTHTHTHTHICASVADLGSVWKNYN
jgi:hypothetical protein